MGKEFAMSIKFRHYNGLDDYKRIDAFLIEHYQPDNADGNWIEPAWEYMYHHPALDSSLLGKIGIWEDNGRIVAVAHFEWSPGEAFFQFHPDYRYLKSAVLDYAEQNLYGMSNDGDKNLHAYVNDMDDDFVSLVKARGYEKDNDSARPMYKFDVPNPFPSIKIPEGFQLKSLADDCDWVKVNRVLWRGFNHEGEPPASEVDIEERRKMFDTPSARRDLKIVIEAPDGSFVAFSGTFNEPIHKFAYVEPVATDPAFRRMGLGQAAVLEGIRRCAALGATVAYVGNDLPIYQAIGFKKLYISECWAKDLGV
jgi:GNAT superfamily N-acetyltransferase